MKLWMRGRRSVGRVWLLCPLTCSEVLNRACARWQFNNVAPAGFIIYLAYNTIWSAYLLDVSRPVVFLADRLCNYYLQPQSSGKCQSHDKSKVTGMTQFPFGTVLICVRSGFLPGSQGEGSHCGHRHPRVLYNTSIDVTLNVKGDLPTAAHVPGVSWLEINYTRFLPSGAPQMTTHWSSLLGITTYAKSDNYRNSN